MSANERRSVTIFINGKEVKNTIKDVSGEYARMRNELRKLTVGSDEYNKKLQDLKKGKAVLNDISKEMREIDRNTAGAANRVGGLKGMLQKISGGGAGGGGMAGALGAAVLGPLGAIAGGAALVTNAIGVVREFEVAMDDLQAITGSTGEQMGYFKEQAISLGKELGKTPTEMVTAFKLVGSARPELLQSEQALTDFTQSAVVLSQASRMDLAESVSHLTTIMNANGAASSESERYINALAAASQKGAKEVPFLAEALSKVGPVANTAGLSIEKTSSILEIFGEKGINSSETAGTQLRNILIKLQGDSANFTNGVFDMDKAMSNLAPIMNDTVTLTKMFGAENVVGAQILAQNVDKINEMEVAITDTNAAHEQSAIQTDNVDGKLNKLKSTWDSVILGMGEGGGVLGGIIDLVTGVISGIGYVFSVMSEAASGLFDAVGDLFVGLGMTNEEAGKSIGVMDILGGIFTLVGTNIQLLVNMITMVVRGLTLIIEGVKAVGEFLTSGTWDTSGMSKAWEALEQQGLKTVDNLKTGVVKAYDEFTGNAKQRLKELEEQGTKTVQTLEEELEGAKDRDLTGTVMIDGKAVLKTINDVGAAYKDLKSEIEGLVAGSDEYNKKMKELAKAKSLLDSMTKAVDGAGKPADSRPEINDAIDQTIKRLEQKGIEEIDLHEEVELAKSAITLRESTAVAEFQKKTAEEVKEEELRIAEETARVKTEMQQLAADTAFTLLNSGLERSSQRELKNLEERRAQGLINEAQYQKAKEDIERKAFRKKKMLDIAQSIINTALAITKIQAQAGVLAPVLIKEAIATGIAQIAVISAQKFKEGGLVTGPGSGTSDSVPAMLSNGEFVIKAASVNASTLPMLKAINQSQGRQIDMNDSANAVRSNMSVAYRAEADSARMMKEMIDQMSRWQKEFTVKLPLRDLDEESARKLRIENLANVG